jgi:Predicted exporter
MFYAAILLLTSGVDALMEWVYPVSRCLLIAFLSLGIGDIIVERKARLFCKVPSVSFVWPCCRIGKRANYANHY